MSLSLSRIALKKKDDEQRAFIAYNGKLLIHILTNKYNFYYATALTPEECALINHLQEQTPIDDGDTNWVMANGILEGHKPWTSAILEGRMMILMIFMKVLMTCIVTRCKFLIQYILSFPYLFPYRHKHHRADGCTHTDHTEKLHYKFCDQLEEMADAYSNWSHDLAHGVDRLGEQCTAGYSMKIYDTYCKFVYSSSATST